MGGNGSGFVSGRILARNTFPHLDPRRKRVVIGVYCLDQSIDLIYLGVPFNRNSYNVDIKEPSGRGV
jgi:hypothetical protein